MRKIVLFLSAAILIGSMTSPAQAQRGGHGFSGGIGRVGDHWGQGFGRGDWGHEFGHWGYGYGYWPLYAYGFPLYSAYAYPYAAYSSFYYPPAISYVAPPVYNVVPAVTYYPVPVAVPTASAADSPYARYAAPAAPASLPASFSTIPTPAPSYPGFVPRASTEQRGYYPDLPTDR